ncbi:MAG: hypothetical protein AAFY12_12275 [Pseudomonadota bacterium]
MEHFVEKSSISVLERGGFDDTAQFLLRTWMRENGNMPPSSTLMQVSPYLVIFDDHFDPGDSPEILFFGSETAFSSKFPEADCEEESNPERLLQPGFRSHVSEAYHAALHGEPVFETIGTGQLLGPRKPTVIYDRLTLRFKKPVGSYLITYSLEREEVWLSPKEDPRDRPDYFQQMLGFRQSLSAAPSSEFRQHERL